MEDRSAVLSRGPNMRCGGGWCGADAVQGMGGTLAPHCDVTDSVSK